jgi:hypothetical protein
LRRSAPTGRNFATRRFHLGRDDLAFGDLGDARAIKPPSEEDPDDRFKDAHPIALGDPGRNGFVACDQALCLSSESAMLAPSEFILQATLRGLVPSPLLDAAAFRSDHFQKLTLRSGFVYPLSRWRSAAFQ